MLNIKKRQEKALKSAALVSFYTRLQTHIAQFYPEYYAELGEEKARILIDYSIEQASVYQIISEQGVCLFTDLLLVLGLDFDESSDYPWANAMLTDPDTPDPDKRINNVFDYAMEVVENQKIG